MWWSKSEKVSVLKREIGILKMQVAGLKKELEEADAFITVLDAENKSLKAASTAPSGPLPTWDGPDSP